MKISPPTMNASRLLVALVTCSFAAGCSMESDPTEDDDVGSAQLPASAAAACAELADLTETHSREDVHASDQLLERYRVLLAVCSEQDPSSFTQRVDEQIAAQGLADALTPDQRAAWHELNVLSRGAATVQFDVARGTPAWIDYQIPLDGATAAEARLDFDRRLWPLTARLFGVSPADTLELHDENEHEAAGSPGDPPTRVARAAYTRRLADLQVFGNVFDLSLRSAGVAPDRWVATVAARWSRAPLVTEPVALSAEDAARSAEAHGDVEDGRATDDVELGVLDASGTPRLAYRVRVDGRGSWTYLVSAATGTVLHAASNVRHYDGSIATYVGRPHEGNGKALRPVPRATIYEDFATFTEDAGCSGGTTTWRRGNPVTTLGATYYSGNYWNLTPLSQSDTTWAIDFRGPYAWDTQGVSILSVNFTAGGAATIPQSTTDLLSRRAEMFYHINSGAEMYRVAGISQYEPLRFKFWHQVGNCSGSDICCTAPSTWTEVLQECVQFASQWDNCLSVDIGNIGTTAHPAVERRLRHSIAHEQGHSIFARSNSSYPCSGGECAHADEGTADFAALMATRFEAGRVEDPPARGYLPSRTYPTDVIGSDYVAGQVWTAAYADLALRIGVDANHRVHRYQSLWDDSTFMVGSCADSNADGFIEALYECPPNSFFRHLLYADISGASGASQRRYEISQVFREHVTDADRNAAGTQQVPWTDELPNTSRTAPFVAVEFGGARTVATGPDQGALLTGFQYSGDSDAVLFLARAGDTYEIETENLASGVDTVLNVAARGAAFGYVNNNCTISDLRSCVTITPTSTKFYAVTASPYSGASTGPGRTYRFRITMVSDDVGDTPDAAMALSASGSDLVRELGSSSDVDVYRISVGDSESMTYFACPATSGPSVTAELLDAQGAIVATNTTTSCLSSVPAYSVSRGTYFLKVSSASGYTGAYKVRAALTSDLDAGGAAWELTNDHRGRVIASRFESAADEDWFYYDVPEDGRFIIVETFGNPSATPRADLEVYAPSTTFYGRTNALDGIPAADDTSGGRGLGHWMLRNDRGALSANGARLAFMAPVAGRYHVRVLNPSGSTAPYQVVFEDTGLQGGWHALP